MWEQLKSQRSKALKIRKKFKNAPLNMSKRNMLRRATLKISQDHLSTRNSLPSRKSTFKHEIPDRMSLQAKQRTTVTGNFRDSVLDSSTSKRLTLTQTAKLAKIRSQDLLN